MATVILWALATGMITGGVWFGIAMMQRREKASFPASKPEDLADLQRRLAEVEERLDFAERQIAQQKEARRLSP